MAIVTLSTEDTAAELQTCHLHLLLMPLILSFDL